MLDQSDQQTLTKSIARFGYHVILVHPSEDRPAFTYSTGIQQTTGQPELIITGLPAPVARQIIKDYYDRMRAGDRIELMVPDPRFLRDVPVQFAPVTSVNLKRHLPVAVSYYGDVALDTYQLIWPSRTGAWPWDAEASADYRRLISA
jgi:hypothetical protein